MTLYEYEAKGVVMKAYADFMQIYNTPEWKGNRVRQGQAFVIMFIKQGDSVMFNADGRRAEVIIKQWLIDHNYIDELPQIIKRPVA